MIASCLNHKFLLYLVQERVLKCVDPIKKALCVFWIDARGDNYFFAVGFSAGVFVIYRAEGITSVV